MAYQVHIKFVFLHKTVCKTLDGVIPYVIPFERFQRKKRGKRYYDVNDGDLSALPHMTFASSTASILYHSSSPGLYPIVSSATRNVTVFDDATRSDMTAFHSHSIDGNRRRRGRLLLFGLFVYQLTLIPPSFGLVHAFLLRFDGSLRSPLDPGFPSVSTHRQYAACSACLWKVDSNGNGNPQEHPLFVGGRRLATVSPADDGKTGKGPGLNRESDRIIQTSGQAEYEGLLLGLEQVSQVFTSTKVGKADETTLTIQGDCKTVLEQLRGRSNARKMERYATTALTMLKKLQDCSTIVVEHIPRKRNLLCDRLAGKIVQEQQNVNLQEAWDVLRRLGRCSTVGPLDYRNILQSYWHNYSPCVPVSLRPTFYRKMAHISTDAMMEDDALGHVLFWIGEMLETDVKTIWQKAKQAPNDPNTDKTSTRDRLLVEAITFQRMGLLTTSQRNPKSAAITRQADALQRRHNFLLRKYTDHVENIKRSLSTKDIPSKNVSDGDILSILTSFESLFSESGAQEPAKEVQCGFDVIDSWFAAAESSTQWIDQGTFWLHFESSTN